MLCVAGSAHPSWAATPTLFNFLQRNVSADLPLPPADGPDAQLIVDMKVLRTSARVAEIRAQAVDPMHLFWDLLPIEAIQHKQLVTDFQSDVAFVVMVLKTKYSRLRPHVVNHAVEPVVEVPWHASYPSGHATQARAMAHLFTRLYPDHANRLFALAERIGRNREVGGVHYVSDTDAGFRLADKLWASTQIP